MHMPVTYKLFDARRCEDWQNGCGLTFEEVLVHLAAVLLGDQHGDCLGGVLRVGSRPTRLPMKTAIQIHYFSPLAVMRHNVQ